MQYQQIDAFSEKALECGEGPPAGDTSPRRSEGGRRMVAVAMTGLFAVSVCALRIGTVARVSAQRSAVTGLMEKYALDAMGSALAESEKFLNETENVTELPHDNTSFDLLEEQEHNDSHNDELPHDEHAHVMEAFSQIDTDMNGSATMEELVNVFNATENFSMEELEQDVHKIDEDHSRTVEWVEFLHMMVGKEEHPDMTEDPRAAFNVWDSDADGGISAAELRDMATRFGDNVSDAEVDDFLHRADTDTSDKIDFEEYMKAFT